MNNKTTKIVGDDFRKLSTEKDSSLLQNKLRNATNQADLIKMKSEGKKQLIKQRQQLTFKPSVHMTQIGSLSSLEKVHFSQDQDVSSLAIFAGGADAATSFL
jgi:hypothetical protein